MSTPQSRRDFLLRAGLAGGATALATAPVTLAADQQCDTPGPPATGAQTRADPYKFPSARTRVRKEVHDLSKDEVKRLAEAYKRLKELKSDNPRSWCFQANLHDRHCAHGPGSRPRDKNAYWVQIHLGWNFLPWHRAYLYFYESILGELIGDETFALPYWDWSNRPKPPDFLFVNKPADDLYPLFHANRDVTAKDSIEDDPDTRNATSPEMIAQILAIPHFMPPRPGLTGCFGGPPDTDQVSGWLQGALESVPHNAIHGWVGGDMGNFSTAARDILFFCHHANVDRLWSLWARMPDHANPTFKPWLERWYDFYEPKEGKEVSVTTADCIDITRVNVAYQEPGARDVVPAAALKDGEKVLTLGDKPVTTEVVSGKVLELKAMAEPARFPDAPKRTVRIAVEGFQAPPDVGMRIRAFVNNEVANAQTPLTVEKGYAGTLFIVPMSAPAAMAGHGHGDHEKPPRVILSLEIGDRFDRLKAGDKMQVTLVPVPLARRGKLDKAQVTFRSVAVVEE
jgi:polyphenol oxidase